MYSYCYITEPPRAYTIVELPNRKTVNIKAVGRCYGRVNLGDGAPFDLGELTVFLLDDAEWDELLIGRDVLMKHQLLPEQNIPKNSAQQQSNQSNSN